MRRTKTRTRKRKRDYMDFLMVCLSNSDFRLSMKYTIKDRYPLRKIPDYIDKNEPDSA